MNMVAAKTTHSTPLTSRIHAVQRTALVAARRTALSLRSRCLYCGQTHTYGEVEDKQLLIYYHS